ncbi:MAG: DUF4167 domain-containing protein [Alphaproteobacteria bacterium]|nr:MAG: DUF4167 domain-containing protein [Alphaproteobacteria bacterium]
MNMNIARDKIQRPSRFKKRNNGNNGNNRSNGSGNNSARIRDHAQKKIDHYSSMARDSRQNQDIVLYEYNMQYVDHFTRILHEHAEPKIEPTETHQHERFSDTHRRTIEISADDDEELTVAEDVSPQSKEKQSPSLPKTDKTDSPRPKPRLRKNTPTEELPKKPIEKKSETPKSEKKAEVST